MDRWSNHQSAGGPPGRIQDKVAVITGASSGIGRAVAILFAHEGAHVVCADIRETTSDQVEDGVISNTTTELTDGLYIRTDVSNAQDMRNLVRRTVDEYGRLDIFVNNAGIAIEAFDPRPIWAADEDVFDLTQRVNTRGVFLGCKYASAEMRNQAPHRNGDRGWIINIGSVYGMVGAENKVSISASKGAVTALTRAVAMDCAPYRVHVNAICPGVTLTETINRALPDEQLRTEMIGLHPFRGLGIPDDIARAALFLASEDAGWMTGVCLPVDGGFTAR
ncbi:hypothetical protein AAFC00_002184 [Neodothiora populina]|uniref:Uncharacterized protein n=1 Tax=Neodothiora populina TaxID=2781224 RepID=A0ABR3PHS0_9PEZI